MLLSRLPKRLPYLARQLATAAPKGQAGDISDVFTSMQEGSLTALPPRFAQLKKDLFKPEMMIDMWKEVLKELEVEAERVKRVGSEIVPRLPFEQIQAGDVDPSILERIKETGTVIIEGAISKEEALNWKHDILAYAELNKLHVRGYPSDNPQVFEFYNTPSQTAARTHPNTIVSQRFLLNSLCHASNGESKVSLKTPISYFDRLRVRRPGDSKFTLGAHIDGGSLERWEDEGYRSCFPTIFNPSSPTSYRDHDPYDVSPRINANTDLYRTGSGQCSIFRPWQGWTSMSSTGPGEGTLRVCPLLKLSTAYVLLRPFFKLGGMNGEEWEVDLESTEFPGSQPGRGQELSTATHPHLRLDDTMVSAPKIKPGDQFYWLSDTIHAVEKEHKGEGDSSVLYIPACPLTLPNAEYLLRQREAFKAGRPSPDFPQGQGESQNFGRASPDDVTGSEARQLLGLQPFVLRESMSSGEENLIRKANEVLFG